MLLLSGVPFLTLSIKKLSAQLSVSVPQFKTLAWLSLQQ
jgi:hypothetical protein